MEQCELLEQMKFQQLIDEITELIPELEELVIGWTTKDNQTVWQSCTTDSRAILWIVECIRHSIMNESYKVS